MQRFDTSRYPGLDDVWIKASKVASLAKSTELANVCAYIGQI